MGEIHVCSWEGKPRHAPKPTDEMTLPYQVYRQSMSASRGANCHQVGQQAWEADLPEAWPRMQMKGSWKPLFKIKI